MVWGDIYYKLTMVLNGVEGKINYKQYCSVLEEGLVIATID